VLESQWIAPVALHRDQDDMVIMASEVGVLDVEPENVLEKRRLEPDACSWWTRRRAELLPTRN